MLNNMYLKKNNIYVCKVLVHLNIHTYMYYTNLTTILLIQMSLFKSIIFMCLIEMAVSCYCTYLIY